MKLTDILRRDVSAVMLASILTLPARAYEVPRGVVQMPARAPKIAEFFKPRAAVGERSSVVVPLFEPSITVTSAIESVVTYTLPALSWTTATYSVSEPVRYEPRSENYVHVPSWVTVSRAPFSQFGRSLFGLAVPSTGSVYVREDLHGKEFTEVLFHEVLHTLYPSCSEGEIRSMVLARFGAQAPIHTHLCRP